jgi:hypothetical protein
MARDLGDGTGGSSELKWQQLNNLTLLNARVDADVRTGVSGELHDESRQR